MIRKNIFFFFLALCACAVNAGLFSSKPKNLIVLELQRVQVDPWIVNNTISDSACLNPEKIDSDYVHQYDIDLSSKCKDSKSSVKIMSQCVFVTTAYQTNFFFENSNTEPFKMVLDLRTPWSWIKSPFCSQFTRNGTFITNTCTYPKKSKNGGEFSRTYECNQNCTQISDKCGEIDLTQEGLSIFGSFISTQIVLSDKNYHKKAIKGFKLIWAHGLSGQSFLQGDGILGLGQQHQSDNFQGNILELDQDVESQEEDEEEADNQEVLITQIHEHGTDLWGSIERTYKQVNPRIFALYLAEHESLKQQLLIGKNAVNQTHLMHLPDQFPIQWVKLPIIKYDSEEELARMYYLWTIPVNQIIFRYGHLKKKNDNDEEEIFGYSSHYKVLLEKESEASLSLQTSALILPDKMLNQIIQTLFDIYNIRCFLSKNYIKYVQCQGLDSPLDVSELAITIHLGYGLDDDVLLNVDPQSLLLGCKKSNGKYNCYLNLQLSVDDHIIFGDAAFRHSYMVFDTEGRRVGFAPAKSKFNENSLWSELKIILEDVEDVIRGDIVFLFRFFLILIFLSAILFLFVNWKKIFTIVKRRFRYSTIVDPAELANLDLDKSDMVIRHASDDQDVADQIQELEQNERFDAL